MLELANIFRAAGPAYREAHAGRLLSSHQRAMDDIAGCRTPAMGGSLYRCDDCGTLDYAYHSCRNRSISASGLRRVTLGHCRTQASLWQWSELAPLAVAV